MNELSDDLMEEFNFSICLELIREHNPDVTEDEAKVIWGKCGGNPFNAGILYKMVELAKENERKD